MTESCAKCCEPQKDCRCGKCASCDNDLGADNKQLMTIFKKRRLFCRHCKIPLCGKCIVNYMCNNCNTVQDSYKALWREIDVNPALSSKEKDIDNAFDDMISAVKEHSLTTLQNLLEHCGKTYLNKSDSEGQTLLHHAVKSGSVEILQYLLDQGGDVNLVDNEGCSPLHHLAAGPRSPRQGQLCDILVSNGINTFLMNNKRETALSISLQTDNFELQTLLEPTMYRDSSAIIIKCLNTKLDLPDDVSACLRYIVSKIKCLNPFEKKQSNKVNRNKSINYRSLKDRGGVVNEGCDPYKLKKTVADNNEKITRLKEEIQALREEVAITSEQHKAETGRLQMILSEEKENKTAALLQLNDYYNNTVNILEKDLSEAKDREEDSRQALQEVLQLNKKYKLCWVPKSVTRKCADPTCKKVFRDGYSQHHCRCCGRVFCYDCSNTRLPIPVYGYDTPVRICSYCYNLLNEEVLCDFDETDIDIDQWNSVHYQNESNVDNLGRKSFFNFGQRSRTGTVTSGYDSKSARTSECGSESPPTSTSSQSSCSVTSGRDDSESNRERSDSESTISGNSDEGGEEIAGSESSEGNLKRVMSGTQWKNFQNMFKKNSISTSRKSFKRSSLKDKKMAM